MHVTYNFLTCQLFTLDILLSTLHLYSGGIFAERPLKVHTKQYVQVQHKLIGIVWHCLSPAVQYFREGESSYWWKHYYGIFPSKKLCMGFFAQERCIVRQHGPTNDPRSGQSVVSLDIIKCITDTALVAGLAVCVAQWKWWYGPKRRVFALMCWYERSRWENIMGYSRKRELGSNTSIGSGQIPYQLRLWTTQASRAPKVAWQFL